MNNKKVLIIPNSFKNNLSSLEVSSLIKSGINSVAPDINAVNIPVSDGGDGFIECIKYKLGGYIRKIETISAVGDKIKCPVLYTGGRVYIEMSLCNGLSQCSKVDYLNTSTYGLGVVIKKVIEDGANDIVVGVGGSASCDVGLGALQALGFTILDKDKNPIIAMTGNLEEVSYIGNSDFILRSLSGGVKIHCWVDANALVDGIDGCWARTIGKGGSNGDESKLKYSVNKLVKIIEKNSGKLISGLDFLGCGGGLSAGFFAFCNADIGLGSENIYKILELDKLLLESEVIITGEGRVDNSTFLKKLPGFIIEECVKNKKQVILVSAKSEIPMKKLREYGVGCMIMTEFIDDGLSFESVKNNSREMIYESGKSIGSLLG